jgi:hypothetical protein
VSAAAGEQESSSAMAESQDVVADNLSATTRYTLLVRIYLISTYSFVSYKVA